MASKRGSYGLTKQPPGKTGEKFIYVYSTKPRNPVRVFITTHDERKQVHVGYFKTIEEAITARDKFLSAHPLNKK